MARQAATRDRTNRLNRGSICTEGSELSDFAGQAMCNMRVMGSNKPVTPR